MPRQVISRDVVVLTGATAAIVAVTVALRPLPVSQTTVALVLLLVVLATATLSRLWVPIVVSIAAMLVLNFYFLPPIGTFTIADLENWVALFGFLIVAIIASNLSTAAQTRAREAVARRNEVTRLFDLSRDVLLTTETAAALDALARHIARRFELPKVAIYVPGGQGWERHQGGDTAVTVEEQRLNTTLATARGTLEFDARRRTYGGHASVAGQGGETIALVPLRHGTRVIGVLAVVAPNLDVGTLDAVAAIAIERAQFFAARSADCRNGASHPRRPGGLGRGSRARPRPVRAGPPLRALLSRPHGAGVIVRHRYGPGDYARTAGCRRRPGLGGECARRRRALLAGGSRCRAPRGGG